MTRVVGGPSSIHANFAELERGIMLLNSAVADAEVLAGRAAGWGATASLVTSLTPYGIGLAGQTVHISTGLVRLGVELEVLHEGVRFAVRSYLQVEAEVSARIDQMMLPASALRLANSLIQDAPVQTTDLERALRQGPDALESLLNTVVPGAGAGTALSVITVLGANAHATSTGRNVIEEPLNQNEQLWHLLSGSVSALGVLQLGRYAVKDTTRGGDDSGWKPVESSDGSPGWMAQNLRGAFAENAGESALQVTRIAAEDGEKTWVVGVPGTQFDSEMLDGADGAPSGDGPGAPADQFASLWGSIQHEDNAWGASGVREAMALESQHVVTAVDEALTDAGAQPGDRIVTLGYSQGGVHAMNVAADPRIVEKYDVDSAVTVGGLSANVDIAEDVNVVHFEHSEDVAIALDGSPNPATLNRTTVIFDGYPEGTDPTGEDAGFFGAAHGYDTYQHHLANSLNHPEVEEKAGPALQRLAAATAGTAATKTFTLQRQKPGRPQNPLSSRGTRESRQTPQKPSSAAVLNPRGRGR